MPGSRPCLPSSDLKFWRCDKKDRRRQGRTGAERGAMGRLLELGERLELVSMDPHFHDISISLYRSTGEGGASGFLPRPQLQRQGGRGGAIGLRDAGALEAVMAASWKCLAVKSQWHPRHLVHRALRPRPGPGGGRRDPPPPPPRSGRASAGRCAPRHPEPPPPPPGSSHPDRPSNFINLSPCTCSVRRIASLHGLEAF